MIVPSDRATEWNDYIRLLLGKERYTSLSFILSRVGTKFQENDFYFILNSNIFYSDLANGLLVLLFRTCSMCQISPY